MLAKSVRVAPEATNDGFETGVNGCHCWTSPTYASSGGHPPKQISAIPPGHFPRGLPQNRTMFLPSRQKKKCDIADSGSKCVTLRSDADQTYCQMRDALAKP